jgi:hypothetical protein
MYGKVLAPVGCCLLGMVGSALAQKTTEVSRRVLARTVFQ